MGHFVSVKLRQVDYELICEIARREDRPYCAIVNRAVVLYAQLEHQKVLKEKKKNDTR